MDLVKKRQATTPLVDQLAEHINLTDAFKLSDQLRSLARMPFTAAPGDTEKAITDIKTCFLEERSQLIHKLIQKSTPSIDNRHLKPGIEENIENLKRFYILQQNEMDQHIHKLRQRIRDVMQGISPAMQQLAILDTLMAETTVKQARMAFSQLPQKLQTRFNSLQQQPDGYNQFLHDMQSLLLAECETRLLPLMGLIEALDEFKQTL
jgi:hypothetical protein